jgi:superfamily II DNA or RNA helicase
MPIKHLHFKYPWRPYQARFLDDIDRHLSDDKLHVVAAPGAGKTTLGLEIFRRLGSPCLVLSPTRIIRNQWIQRLVDFIPQGESVENLPWVSQRLDKPGYLTSITYQALHTRFRKIETHEAEAAPTAPPPDRAELKSIIALVRQAGVKTLILDEAHHLRSAWWRALQLLVDGVDGLKVVSLTATPPYDVVGSEWSRYLQLCGPIDAEISVPELVHSGTLAPHQDLCWVVSPSVVNRVQIADYEGAVAHTIGELEQDGELRRFVLAHPWLSERAAEEAELLESMELAVSLLVYLKARELPLPEGMLATLGIEPRTLPALDRRWWNVLVEGLLFHPGFGAGENLEGYRKELAHRLRSRKLLHRKRLSLAESQRIGHALAASQEKIGACADIVELERAVRGESLRQVILTEYIREEAGLSLDVPSLSLGAWPIFKAVFTATTQVERPFIALLTGRLTLVHRQHAERMQELGGRMVMRPVSFDDAFVRVEGDSQSLARALTALLEAGELRVLVGTRALLGEGWDCPVVNSLVLATSVDTYMTTNQMRGRTIRVDRNDRAKVASIWHLVALEIDFASGLADYNTLQSRFKTFVGIHHRLPTIESGLERLQLPVTKAINGMGPKVFKLRSNNREMENRLASIADIADHWRLAINDGREHRIIPGIRTPGPPSFRKLHFGNTLRWLFLEIGAAFSAVMLQMLSGIVKTRIPDVATILMVVKMMLAVGFLWALPRAFRAVRAWVRHYPVDGSVRQIALCLRNALCETGTIETGRHQLEVVTAEFGGVWSFHLSGGTFYEQSVFTDSLREILAPIENPRYLITRGQGRKTDFHAVPTVLATHKEKALVFSGLWNRRVAVGELIYTRNREGRALLLKARALAFSSEFVSEAERLDQWQ